MMNFIHKRKHQRGIGLLELMLSLAIIAILLVMATRYFLVASLNEKVNTMINTVGGYQAALNCYQGAKTNVTLKQMSDAGCLASQLWDPDTSATKPVNGPWGPGTWTPPSATQPYGVITFETLPQDACRALANKYINDANAQFNKEMSDGTKVVCTQTDNDNEFTYDIR